MTERKLTMAVGENAEMVKSRSRALHCRRYRMAGKSVLVRKARAGENASVTRLNESQVLVCISMHLHVHLPLVLRGLRAHVNAELPPQALPFAFAFRFASLVCTGDLQFLNVVVFWKVLCM